jgi:adenylate cyclase
MQVGRFLAELKRRRVFRVTAMYAAAAFIVAQVADIAFPALRLPEWALTLVIVLLLLGLPVALALSWAFELTPQGLVRDEGEIPADRIEPAAGHVPRWRAVPVAVAVGTIVAALAAGYVVFPAADFGTAVQPTTESDRSIAILPFENLSADPEQEYFSDGLTEEILNAISMIPGVHVAARGSAFSFKGQRVPVDSIASALRVAYVLEGSVRRYGERLRVTAQLTDARSGFHVWSQTFERRAVDVFEIQDQIAFAIADALRTRLPGGENTSIRAHSTDPATYDLYLRGRFALNQRTQPALEEAVELFNEAHRRDRGFASALAGLADAHLLLTEYGWVSQEEGLTRAVDAARGSLSLDAGIAESHISAGYVMYWTRDFDGAERAFRRAIELNPSAVAAHQWYAELLLTLGRSEEAVARMALAQRLDPLTDRIRIMLAFVLMRARRYEESLALNPVERDARGFGHSQSHVIRAHCYSGLGRHAMALAEMERARELDPVAWNEWRMPDHAHVLVRLGRMDEAERLLDRHRERSRDSPGYGAGMARMHAALLDAEGTLEWLGRTLAEQPTSLIHQSVGLRNNIIFDFLRDDPRFVELLGELGVQ